MKVSEVLRTAIRFLQEKGIPEPQPDASLLLAKSLNTNRQILPLLYDDPMPALAAVEFNGFLERRLAREPVQYILGKWGFMDFDLEVGPGALVPRHETEDWLEILFSIIEKNLPPKFRVADIGTGTGAIGISVGRRFPGSCGVMCDLSCAALHWARKNIYSFPDVSTRFCLARCDLLSGIGSGLLDLVVSNPPYIEKKDIAGLMPEVSKYEPEIALDGGEDGLGIIARLLTGSGRVMRTGGFLAFEHGAGQRKKILGLPSPGLSLLEFGNDLCGHERFVIYRRV